MERKQLNALFALMEAFPQERHYVDMHGTLVFQIQLTEEQHKFWQGAARMMETVDADDLRDAADASH